MKKKLLVLLSLFAFTASTAFAGNCNYTIKSLAKQLPFPMDNVKIVKQQRINKNICNVIVKVTTPMGDRYASLFEIENTGVIVGNLFKNKRNLTAKSVNEIRNKNFMKVFVKVANKLDSAVIATYKPKKANGKSLYVFIDPLCPFCKRIEPKLSDIADKTGYTVKLIPLIVHGKKSYNDITAFICNHKTYKDYVTQNYGEVKQCEQAKKLLRQAWEIEKTLNVMGTPTFITSDGKMLPGGTKREIMGMLK